MLTIVPTNSKPVKHGRPGIGATHSSRFIPLSTYILFSLNSYRATANPQLQSKLFPFSSFFSLVDTVFSLGGNEGVYLRVFLKFGQ